MTLKTNKFARKPFYVDAIQVTSENIEDVAEWCQGDIEELPEQKKRYIKVRVLRPMNPRQTKAFVGDWVLYAGTGFKVYTDKAFHNSFEAEEPQSTHAESMADPEDKGVEVPAEDLVARNS